MADKDGKRFPLVLVIDVDNDVEEVLGEPVIVGGDNVERAVLEYGEKRPEDADVNAMLAGLQAYKKLGGDGRAEIAVVGGHPVDSIEAQRLIKERVSRIVEEIRARTGRDVELILVSDGEDELLLSEVLRDIAPISGVRRVVIEQHLGIEGSYILVFRYIKKAMFDPRFSKYFMGIPGFALLVFSLLSLFNLLDVAIKLALMILGASMIVRGFNLESQISALLSGLVESIQSGHPLKIAGIIVLAVSIIGSLIVVGITLYSTPPLGEALASISKYALSTLSAGIAGYILLSRLLYNILYGSVSTRDLSSIIFVAGVAVAFYSLGSYMEASGANLRIGVIASSLLESGFISYIIIAAGVAALVDSIGRALHRRHD